MPHGHAHRPHGSHHAEDPFRPGEAVEWGGLEERQRASLWRADAWWALLGRPVGERLADIGCASGLLSARYADLGAEVLAVDVRPDALARVPDHPRLRTLLHDLQRAPLPEPVDAVVLTDVLHHFPAPAEALRNARASAPRILVAESLAAPREIRLAPEEVARLLREAGYEPAPPAWTEPEHFAIVARAA